MSDQARWQDLPGAPAGGTVLCTLADIADGTVRIVSLRAGGNMAFDAVEDGDFSLLLARSGDAVQAWANRCAHFGVPLAKTARHLIYRPHQSLSCNVHYARYRWSDGVCTWGDCEGESLVAIPVGVDADGRVVVGPGT